MKTTIYKFTGLILIIMGLSLSVNQCTDAELLDQINALEDELSRMDSLSQQLTDEEINGILFMREEEKLARDVYLYLYDVHPLRPFLNISKSEQAHMDAIKYLIDTYGLEDPVGDNPEGLFQNEELQKMYDELIERGSESKEEALKVGALIEEVDIIDLQHELESIAENEDVKRVFQNLCDGSENHLRAFVRVLGTLDVEYRPVLLEDSEFDRIMSE